jgi:hypothetical protein
MGSCACDDFDKDAVPAAEDKVEETVAERGTRTQPDDGEEEDDSSHKSVTMWRRGMGDKRREGGHTKLEATGYTSGGGAAAEGVAASK